MEVTFEGTSHHYPLFIVSFVEFFETQRRRTTGKERAGTAGAANVNADEKDHVFLYTEPMLVPWPPELVSAESRLQRLPELLLSYPIRAEGERKAEGRKEEWRDCI